MNEDTKQYIEKLKARADVLGVIMFGSWARGNNRPDSDVDLVVILTEGYRRTVEYNNKQAFEIIYTTANAAIDFWQSHKDDCYGLWAVAKIVFDKDGTIEMLKNKAEEVIKAGKTPIDKFQIGQFRFSVEDELAAVDAMVVDDPATANLVLTKTVTFLTELYFDLRLLWIPAPKQRLAKLKQDDSVLFGLFNDFYKDGVSLNEKLKVAKEIVPVVFKV
jgi:predicted nucleotidyltransferase